VFDIDRIRAQYQDVLSYMPAAPAGSTLRQREPLSMSHGALVCLAIIIVCSICGGCCGMHACRHHRVMPTLMTRFVLERACPAVRCPNNVAHYRPLGGSRSAVELWATIE